LVLYFRGRFARSCPPKARNHEGDGLKAGSKTAEVVRIMITDAGRKALESDPKRPLIDAH
jgi:hypothetical protein